MDLRKSAEAFFEFLEQNNIKDFSELPPEQLQNWMILKSGQRLNLYVKDELGPPPDNVVPLKRRKEKVLR